MIGWASAPYDFAWALRHPKRSAVMSVCGPCANLLLVLISGIILRYGIAYGFLNLSETGNYFSGDFSQTLYLFLYICFMLNLLLFIFNMIPFPPFDGSAAVCLFLKNSAARDYMRFIHGSGFSFFGIFIGWMVINRIFTPVSRFAIDFIIK